jgi:hypothetical protein
MFWREPIVVAEGVLEKERVTRRTLLSKRDLERSKALRCDKQGVHYSPRIGWEASKVNVDEEAACSDPPK